MRDISRGVYPPLLAACGVVEALRAQARRASVEVSVEGTAPRSTDEAEVGVYFCCLEAMQNVAEHGGRAAHVALQLHHEHGTLAVRIEDDGDGFDPALTPDGAGLRNIHDRIQTLGGTLKLTFSPGRGTMLTIALPWSPRRPKTASTDPRVRAVAPSSMTAAGMASQSSSHAGVMSGAGHADRQALLIETAQTIARSARPSTARRRRGTPPRSPHRAVPSRPHDS